MTCRTCGAEIAEKAIVCYRCGTPTAGPAVPAKTTTRARTPWAIVGTAIAAALATIGFDLAVPDHLTAISVGGGLLVAALGAWAAARWPGR